MSERIGTHGANARYPNVIWVAPSPIPTPDADIERLRCSENVFLFVHKFIAKALLPPFTIVMQLLSMLDATI